MEITVTFKVDPEELRQAILDRAFFNLTQKLDEISGSIDEYKSKAPVIEIKKKPAEKPAPPTIQKFQPAHPIRVCAKCKKEYTPAGPRQKYCSKACGLVPKSEKEKSKAKSPKVPIEPIEKTIAEVERIQHERESKPYEFGK